MVSAVSLKDQLEAKIREIGELTQGVSESQAEQSPAEGEWCVREVLSHLAGQETQSFYGGMKRFLEEDTPDLGVTPGETYLNEARQNASVDELRRDVVAQYTEMASWIGGLSDEELNRKAYVPFLKETPLTDYPTLAQWIGATINYHLPSHVDQLRHLCK